MADAAQPKPGPDDPAAAAPSGAAPAHDMPPRAGAAAPEGQPRRDGWPASPVIYEIYPRSFYDSTGSGEGDLRGVTARLGHVASLGVDAIWLAPFYLSPMLDGGYDVQDHAAINPRFGTMADFDALIARAHDLGLKVMIDQVLNHTSHRHPWFAASVERRGGYDDWYVWHDPKPDGTPPNNWLSQFGPPAWTWNHVRRQYYFHQFLDLQPNLNLRHPAVLEAQRAHLRAWRDRGVDGFRFDAITSYLWDESFADNPPASPEVAARIAGPSFNPYTMQDHEHDMLPGDGTEFAGTVREWSGPDMFLLGEVTSGNRSVELANGLCGPDGLDAAYTVDLTERGCTPAAVADVLSRLETPGTLAWWLTSHDSPRAVSKMGDGSERDARLLALLLAALPGPWLIYQGEEIGLPQPYLDFHETTDPFDRMYWPSPPGREGPRVPIPWAEGYVGFGFTSGTPWLPMRWDAGASVAMAEACAESVLHFHRRLIDLRRTRGFGAGTAVAVKAEGHALRLTVEAPSGRFASAFNLATDGPPLAGGLPEGDPLIASSPLEGGALPPRTGAIWAL